jgi:hypothetical protein
MSDMVRTCIWCDEIITPDEMRTAQHYLSGQSVHYECGLRSAVGSVGHQKKECSCYGGDQEDPPGSTRRQAAVAAMEYFYSKTRPH